MATFKDARFQGDQPNRVQQTSKILNFSFRTNLLNYASFWRGEQRTKRVRPTGSKAFDDIHLFSQVIMVRRR